MRAPTETNHPLGLSRTTHGGVTRTLLRVSRELLDQLYAAPQESQWEQQEAETPPDNLQPISHALIESFTHYNDTCMSSQT